jgi:hypothetical protein
LKTPLRTLLLAGLLLFGLKAPSQDTNRFVFLCFAMIPG